MGSRLWDYNMVEENKDFEEFKQWVHKDIDPLRKILGHDQIEDKEIEECWNIIINFNKLMNKKEN